MSVTKEASLGDIISVRTESAEPLSFYRAMGLEVNLRGHVIVETDRGVEYGQVVGFTDDSNPKVVEPVRSIIRIATEEDEQRNELNIDNESKFFDICEGKINEHGLNMKLVRVKCLFDGNKIIFYFTAETRVDFRSLVKDLASIFKTRIELRQVGSRDEARLVGGLGICGRNLCCSKTLPEFAPVSIKMAKEQNLPLTPTTISGICGRLMCCLSYENSTYLDLKRNMPNIGMGVIISSTKERGKVIAMNVLTQMVRVELDERDETEIEEYNVKDLTFRKVIRPGDERALHPKDMDIEE